MFQKNISPSDASFQNVRDPQTGGEGTFVMFLAERRALVVMEADMVKVYEKKLHRISFNSNGECLSNRNCFRLGIGPEKKFILEMRFWCSNPLTEKSERDCFGQTCQTAQDKIPNDIL